MSCGFRREMLALHVEGDLSDAAEATTVRHLAGCEECRRFLDELQASQALVKSVRREAIHLSDCTAMRREVMAIDRRATGPARLAAANRVRRRARSQTLLRDGGGSAGRNRVRVRARADSAHHAGEVLPIRARRPRHAAAPGRISAMDAREWAPGGHAARDGFPSRDRVYINLSSYREDAKTGIFPEGTVFVWEGPEGTPSARRPALDLVHASGVPQGQHEVRGRLGLF